MARPRCWFVPKAFSAAKKAARDRGHTLWKYTRGTRPSGTEKGYYVGKTLPVRLSHAEVEEKAA